MTNPSLARQASICGMTIPAGRLIAALIASRDEPFRGGCLISKGSSRKAELQARKLSFTLGSR